MQKKCKGELALSEVREHESPLHKQHRADIQDMKEDNKRSTLSENWIHVKSGALFGITSSHKGGTIDWSSNW